MLSKKLTLTLLTLSAACPLFAAGVSAQITTVPSPAVTNKALEVRIETQDMGSEVYCYTWCKDLNGTEKAPFTWEGANTEKFRMSGSAGSYTLSIPSIKEFYGLTDAELSGLKSLGFIAKTKTGQQTDDLFISVEQGRTNVYGGGEGSVSDPFILKTAAHLVEFSTTAQDWSNDVYVSLGADIDASALTSTIGSVSSPYKGHFDGAGHTISNFSLSASTLGTAAGLFGAIDGAEIHDLGVKGATVSGVSHAGLLVGKAVSGTISRCYANGTVSGSSICVGGLVGENAGATISDCYTVADVINDDDCATGGIVGKNSGTVRNVYATGEISGSDYVGGIVGANYGTIRNSVAINAKVTGAHEYTARFGGNANSLNTSEGNLSWDAIDKGSADWTDNGDHATTQSASSLGAFQSFAALTGWDFDNTWEWKNDAGMEWPALRGIASQTTSIPDAFYGVITGVEEIMASDNVSVQAGPNPFTDHITVRATSPLASVELYSLDGALAASASCLGENETTITTAGAASGIYVLRAATADGSRSTFKLIKL